MADTIIYKFCTKCNRDKPLSEFAMEKRKGNKIRMSRCKSCMAHFSREYYSKTKPRRNALQKKYRETWVDNSFKIKSKDPTTREYLSLKRRSLRASALNRDIFFDLDLDDIKIIYSTIDQPCPICGDVMIKPSVDRVDNTKGYESGNCKLICYSCNTGKNCLTPKSIAQIYRYVFGDISPSDLDL